MASQLLTQLILRFPYSYTTHNSDGQLPPTANIYTLRWADENGTYPIGYMLPKVVNELATVPEAVWNLTEVDHDQKTVQIRGQRAEKETTTAVANLAAYWREKGAFKLLRGWRDELWPVYGRSGELLFSMERAAVGLFGAMRYGVHLTAYVVDHSAPHGLKIWVPKRASDKSTFPGMLDNTVAGGLMTDEDPFECIIREADEEASLSEALVRNNAKEVGTVTYVYITNEEHVGEADFIYPECQWVYDLELSADTTPCPKDGEVEEFRLCDIDEIKKDLAAGNFKDNCALVMLDFFIRHGILSDAKEPSFASIQRRMHRKIPFPGPHQLGWVRAPSRSRP